MLKSKCVVSSLVIVTLAGFGSPLLAGDVTARLHGALFQPADHFRLGPGVPETELDVQTSNGGGILAAVEYRLGRRLGLDLGALHARLGIDATVGFTGVEGELRAHDTLRVLPITIGLDVHVTPDRRVDVYLGPRLAVVQFAEVDFDFSDAAFRVRYPIDRDQTYAALVGADFPAGRHWAASAALLYLSTTAQAQDLDARIDLDLRVATFGVAYRF